jgi:chromosome segregation protein
VGVFLKRIELFGFKSFAERTSIDFSGGISAVLGPNGCGKSNIVDSLKWVIGEQSTKILRTERMDEVIFNGTESRGALNVAEVTLTLSNDGGVLPLDLPEISIKRRLFRSGESEYFINRSSVRLKDIRELFFDTGIGKPAYSVIEQGKIDQILSEKPEDRRTIFEEAAGITRYRIKGQEAERRLAQTESNMLRVDSILGEVKRSYTALKAQAEKTEKYRTLKGKLFEAEVELQLLQLRQFLEKKSGKESVLTARNNKRDKLQRRIDGINVRMEETIDLINSMESDLIEAQKKLYGIDLEQNNRDSQIRILKERTGEIEKKIEEESLREKSAQGKLSDLSQQRQRTVGQSADLSGQIEEIEDNIGNFGRDIAHFASRIADNESTASGNEKEILALDGELNQLGLSLRDITDDIVSQLDSQLSETGYSELERRRMEERIEELLSSLQIHWEGKLSLLRDIAKLDQGEETHRENRADANRILLEDSLEKLRSLAELYRSYKESVPSFLSDFLSPQGIMTRKREIDRSITEARSRIDRLKSTNETLRDANRSLNGKIEEYRKTLEDLKINRARLVARRASLEETIERLNDALTEQESFLHANAKLLAESRDKAQETLLRIERLEQERGELVEEEKELKEATARLEVEIGGKNTSLMKEEKRLKEEMNTLLKLQKEIEGRVLELAELKSEIKHLHLIFKERHGRDLGEFEAGAAEVSSPASELRRRINTLKEKIRELGHINLMAPEEFAEVKERYDFLSLQLADLRSGRQDLARITEEIQAESKKLFDKAFRVTKKNFHEMFRRLFGGGKAELRLANPANSLESGIEILAQPPGKRLESIGLLSGGERALTAVALLFAIHLTKPSPFCVLDEIDAALDETNIEKFVGLLQDFTRNTQFVVITHNKSTIAAAQTLLGVTMEESGISKLVTARLKNHDTHRGGTNATELLVNN